MITLKVRTMAEFSLLTISTVLIKIIVGSQFHRLMNIKQISTLRMIAKLIVNHHTSSMIHMEPMEELLIMMFPLQPIKIMTLITSASLMVIQLVEEVNG